MVSVPSPLSVAETNSAASQVLRLPLISAAVTTSSAALLERKLRVRKPSTMLALGPSPSAESGEVPIAYSMTFAKVSKSSSPRAVRPAPNPAAQAGNVVASLPPGLPWTATLARQFCGRL